MRAAPGAAADGGPVRLAGPWTHRDVSANGARFHVAELGEGPLVLLLHGFPQFWWSWRHQLEELAAAGFRAVAMDLRGVGGSDHTPRGYDPPSLALDVAGVIRSLGERDAVVVGHGWGGYLAWTLAVMRPSVVRRLAVASMPHPRIYKRALWTGVRGVRARRMVLGFQLPWVPERRLVHGGAEAVGRMLRDWSGPSKPDEEAVRVYRRVMQVPGAAHCAVEPYRWLLRSVPRPDGIRFAQRMKRPVRVPVLQLHGVLDPTVPARAAAGSSRCVAAPYRWRLLDGVGHFPQEEAPEVFATELIGWLNDPEPDR
ncbi:alpha/beta hydrolase [Mangrovactinospora gilvigrisea]|uniref:Alpha/beta hydrolase n=2 Tax=Mangrovactinospora gilvigrisea TaxID=1428644 RepID=A0A1J7CDY0_9ACTN|nr:alpha/beta hydrolase [Mangrovactinospora gilvigrisea]